LLAISTLGLMTRRTPPSSYIKYVHKTIVISRWQLFKRALKCNWNDQHSGALNKMQQLGGGGFQSIFYHSSAQQGRK